MMFDCNGRACHNLQISARAYAVRLVVYFLYTSTCAVTVRPSGFIYPVNVNRNGRGIGQRLELPDGCVRPVYINVCGHGAAFGRAHRPSPTVNTILRIIIILHS